jgi:hypothetical protein
MKNLPTLQNKIAESIFTNKTFTKEQLNEILACEKTSLTSDLLSIIVFCNCDIEDIPEEVSYNSVVYALFLLKEINAPNQLITIFNVLKWSDDTIDFWFGDSLCEYFWDLICHFGKDDIDSIVAFLKEDNIDTFSKEQGALALYQLYLKFPDKREHISTHWTALLEFYNNLPIESSGKDESYLAFFVCYIAEPNENQSILIKNLYDKEYIDLDVNGGYEDLYGIIEPKKEFKSLLDVNNDLIKFEKMLHKDYGTSLSREFNELIKSQTPIVSEKINRNEPCPCGSGKKYKKCCMD